MLDIGEIEEKEPRFKSRGQRKKATSPRALLSRERAAAGGGSVKGGVKRGTSGTKAKRTLDGVPGCVKSTPRRARGRYSAEIIC